MTEFAHKAALSFEPGLSNAAAVDAAATAYSTPAAHREKLADLARLSYVRGEFRYRVELNQASAAGTATVRLTDGTNTLASAELDLSAAQTFNGALNADLSNTVGSAELRCELEVTAGADAGTTAQVAAVLVVEHPLVIGAC